MSDTRFFCLRIMSDCLALYLTSTDMQGTANGAYGSHDELGLRGSDKSSPAAALDVLLRSHVVPLVPVLLELEDPMPLYALKVCWVTGRTVCVVGAATSLSVCAHKKDERSG
jgi:serine/threonine-protein kinase ULK4